MRRFVLNHRGRLAAGIVLLSLVFCLKPATVAASEHLTPEQVAVLIPQLFHLHLSQHDVDAPFTKRMLKEFVTQLDPINRFYLKSEADAVVNLNDEELTKLGEQALSGDFSHFTEIYNNFINTQIARDAQLYAGLAERVDQIKAEVENSGGKVASAGKPAPGSGESSKTAPLPPKPVSSEEKPSTPGDAAPKVASAPRPNVENAKGDEDEMDPIKWSARPATHEERESRLLKAAAGLYRINKTYLSDTEAFKLSLQTVAEEHDKWLSKPADQEVPALFLKAFMSAMDPHTAYFDADDDEFVDRLEPSFAGIGVQIRPCPLGAQVEDIIKGGPSEKSGKFARGDQIVAVDNFVLAGLPINKIVRKIKGEKGTEVKLTLLKRESKQTETFSIKRDTIQLADMRVKGKKFDTDAGTIGVISVQNFYRGVHKDVHDRINELSAGKPLAGMVLDLRYNQGGYLEEAVSLAGLFITQGPIVGERDGDNRIDWKYDDDVDAFTFPLVVLSSQFSASASEIVAGSLKDYNRALIVAPTQTFGKGTVQRVIPLSTLTLPGEIKITTHQYFLAGGASVQLKGVEPDVVIPGPKLMEDLLERASENAVPWNQIEGKLDRKDPDVVRWTAWKREHLAEIQENSKKRIDSNPEITDAFDPKKLKLKAKDAAANEPKKALNPDEAPPLEEKKDEKDLQAEEAVAIVKDMTATWPGANSQANAKK